MKTGDLVVWSDKTFRNKKEYAVVLEVRNWGSLRPEEVFVKFPSDGSDGWYLSSTLSIVEDIVKEKTSLIHTIQ